MRTRGTLILSFGFDLFYVLWNVVRTATFSCIVDMDWVLDAKCFDIERDKDAEIAST